MIGAHPPNDNPPTWQFIFAKTAISILTSEKAAVIPA